MKKHWTDIKEDEFISAYNAYPPNWWIRFVFKYFSKNDERKDVDINNFMLGLLFGLIGIGLFGSLLNWSKEIMSVITLTYATILAIIVSVIFSGVIMNNKRIKKIAKSLNISVREYDFLVTRYL